MGKLTDSLKATTARLGAIKHGINQMQELGRELADNTLVVADAALRTGYAYAKAEAAIAQSVVVESLPMQALPSTTEVPDSPQLGQAKQWTEKTLKERFGDHHAAYRYLRDTYGIQMRHRSWKNIVKAFNNNSEDCTLTQRVVQLEQTVAQQGQYIAVLEQRLNEVVLHLQQLIK